MAAEYCLDTRSERRERCVTRLRPKVVYREHFSESLAGLWISPIRREENRTRRLCRHR